MNSSGRNPSAWKLFLSLKTRRWTLHFTLYITQTLKATRIEKLRMVQRHLCVQGKKIQNQIFVTLENSYLSTMENEHEYSQDCTDVSINYLVITTTTTTTKKNKSKIYKHWCWRSMHLPSRNYLRGARLSGAHSEWPIMGEPTRDSLCMLIVGK